MAIKNALDSAKFEAEFFQEQIQGMLHGRIVEHLDNEKLKRIADPGLIVRVITPEVIKEVLAGPCDLQLRSSDEAAELFDSLRNEVSLVEPGEVGSLRHRSDVRTIMLPLLRLRLGPKASLIDAAAVHFWSQKNGPAARAEEIYHRLWLQQEQEILNQRWISEAGPFLDTALDEFNEIGIGVSAFSRIWLADKLGRDVPKELRAQADQQIWERECERRILPLIESGSFVEALHLLNARRERTPNSPVRLREIEILRLLGRDDDALRLINDGLSVAGLSRYYHAFLLWKALLEERHLELVAARGTILEVGELAASLGEDELFFLSAIVGLRLLRKLYSRDAPEVLQSPHANVVF